LLKKPAIPRDQKYRTKPWACFCCQWNRCHSPDNALEYVHFISLSNCDAVPLIALALRKRVKDFQGNLSSICRRHCRQLATRDSRVPNWTCLICNDEAFAWRAARSVSEALGIQVRQSCFDYVDFVYFI
jgi:hypothetical protein